MGWVDEVMGKRKRQSAEPTELHTINLEHVALVGSAASGLDDSWMVLKAREKETLLKTWDHLERWSDADLESAWMDLGYDLASGVGEDLEIARVQYEAIDGELARRKRMTEHETLDELARRNGHAEPLGTVEEYDDSVRKEFAEEYGVDLYAMADAMADAIEAEGLSEDEVVGEVMKALNSRRRGRQLLYGSGVVRFG